MEAGASIRDFWPGAQTHAHAQSLPKSPLGSNGVFSMRFFLPCSRRRSAFSRRPRSAQGSDFNPFQRTFHRRPGRLPARPRRHPTPIHRRGTVQRSAVRERVPSMAGRSASTQRIAPRIVVGVEGSVTGDTGSRNHLGSRGRETASNDLARPHLRCHRPRRLSRESHRASSTPAPAGPTLRTHGERAWRLRLGYPQRLPAGRRLRAVPLAPPVCQAGVQLLPFRRVNLRPGGRVGPISTASSRPTTVTPSPSA